MLSLILAVGIAAATSNAAAQQPTPPAPAGATRPHLRVLQALPESQLFPVMNLVADSLGVRCDYCHVQATPDFARTPSNLGGWVWDRDDKPQKRTALEMMRMVVELNTASFRGESRITCYTCHRGSTQPARTVPMPPRPDMPRTPVALPLPPADRVWTDYVNAVGQTDIPAGSATVLTGWDDRPEGRYGKVEITVARDGYRASLTTPDGTNIQALDADGGWVAANNRVITLSGDDVARARRASMRYRPVKADRPANLQVVGVDRVADRDVFVATGRIDAVTTRTLYFDAVTGLLRRDLITTETLLVPLEDQADYDDYRDVDGVRLPFRIRLSSDGAPYATVTRTFTLVRRGVPVDPALFRPPPR